MQKTGFESITQYLVSEAFIASVIIVVVAMFLLYIIKQYLIKKVAYTGKDDQHKNTLIGVVFNIIQYAVVIGALILVLKANGLNITSLLAGLGIMATIIGLALQDTLKDIIAGINIYNNNFYKVGDLVMYNGEECDVKYFSARVTKFQSVISKSTYTVCNSTITSIEKIKDNKKYTFWFPFEEDKERIDRALTNVVERMKDTPNLKEINYGGLWAFTTEGIGFGISYVCPAHKMLPIRAKLLNLAYEEFKKAGVVPMVNRFYYVNRDYEPKPWEIQSEETE